MKKLKKKTNKKPMEKIILPSGFLETMGATKTERKIYSIIISQYKKLERPVKNADIATVHKTHRTNIKNHLANMIVKGLLKKYTHQTYIPIYPESKG